MSEIQVTKVSVIRGLRMETELAQALTRYAESQAKAHGLKKANLASAARHLIRIALKTNPEHSCKREGYFAGIAESKRKMAEALNE